MTGPSERVFETAICESLVLSGGYAAVKVGKAAWLERSAPSIYAQARVEHQWTCLIGELIRPKGETHSLACKSTMRWDVNKGE